MLNSFIAEAEPAAPLCAEAGVAACAGAACIGCAGMPPGAPVATGTCFISGVCAAGADIGDWLSHAQPSRITRRNSALPCIDAPHHAARDRRLRCDYKQALTGIEHGSYAIVRGVLVAKHQP